MEYVYIDILQVHSFVLCVQIVNLLLFIEFIYDRCKLVFFIYFPLLFVYMLIHTFYVIVFVNQQVSF